MLGARPGLLLEILLGLFSLLSQEFPLRIWQYEPPAVRNIIKVKWSSTAIINRATWSSSVAVDDQNMRRFYKVALLKPCFSTRHSKQDLRREVSKYAHKSLTFTVWPLDIRVANWPWGWWRVNPQLAGLVPSLLTGFFGAYPKRWIKLFFWGGWTYLMIYIYIVTFVYSVCTVYSYVEQEMFVNQSFLWNKPIRFQRCCLIVNDLHCCPLAMEKLYKKKRIFVKVVR